MKRRLAPFIILSLILGLLWSSCDQEDKEEEMKIEAREIHEKILTVDTHCDTPGHMVKGDWDVGERHEPGQEESHQIDLPRMAEGGLDAAFFAVYVSQEERMPEAYSWAKENAMLVLDAIHQMAEKYPHLVELAMIPEDALRLEKEGKRAIFIGMENGFPIGKDLSLVSEYYQRGVRYITLCHSQDNDICDSSTDKIDPEDNGLSEFGNNVVEECNRLGIIVDVSHVSDKSFFDVLKVSKTPVIASHSSVRAICDHPRNMSDEMIEALASKGGVIQICFYSGFIKPQKPNLERNHALARIREKYKDTNIFKDKSIYQKRQEEYSKIWHMYQVEKATLKDVVDHIDYVVKLVGVDFVGIGTDFDGGGGVRGCNDVTEMPNITEELLSRGYSEEEIQKIWGGNLMRVFRRVVEVSENAK
jgi:membrane dipeptidase